MSLALKEAGKAYLSNEVPVGAVIVKNNKIIARAHNLIKTKKDPTAHAEILAIRKASKKIKNECLLDTNLYVTVEPCSMCVGAIIHSRINKLIIGANDPKTGACGSAFRIINSKKSNHKIIVKKGVLKKECSDIIKKFFQKKRKAG